MIANVPQILALDFDGVICDGLIEYFQTASVLSNVEAFTTDTTPLI